MWLLSSDQETALTYSFMILIEKKEDVLAYLDMDRTKRFTVQYVPIWTPPPADSEKPEKKIYPELVPLSRAKEEN